jgi:hypothetical protein
MKLKKQKPAPSGWFFGKGFYALEKNEGSVFAHAKVNDQRTDHRGANLHSQRR